MWDRFILPKLNSNKYKTQYQWLSNGTWYPAYHPKKSWMKSCGGGCDLSRIFMTKGAEVYNKKYNLSDKY